MNTKGVSRRSFVATGVAAATAMLARRGWAEVDVSQVASEPTDLSIAEAGRLIRSGALAPRTIVEAYLERIARIDSRLNSFVTVTGEQALTAARVLQEELANGRWRGPLHGIPIALKDNIDTAGVRTTASSALFADRIPDQDAEVVRRLREAGAVILGKLNMHEFAYGATSAITNHGPVRNPWDEARVPGGSSGGSGAAVSARLCAGALGTDTGGSVRIPAAYCGIVGLKATHGLASIRGIIPLSPSFDHVGPMCRSVEDAAFLLQGMAGYDPMDAVSVRSEVPVYSSAMMRGVSRLRLGVPSTPFFEDLDSQIQSVVGQALDVLTGLASGRASVQLPSPPTTPVVLVEAYEYHAEYLVGNSDKYGAATLQRILRGRDIAATAYARGRYELAVIRRRIAEVFSEVDLLVTPTMQSLPITVEDARTAPDDAIRIRNTMPFNIFGIPTITIPCGFSREGLPIGLQISGPAFGELDVLAIAHAYQQVTDWHTRTPPLA